MLGVLIALAVTITLSGCSAEVWNDWLKPKDESTPRLYGERRDTLIVGRAADAIGLDPAKYTDTESVEVAEQIFEHLVRYRPDSTQVEPQLAQSWSVSPDGMVWTFELRSGVTFHDGTPLDADAVVFSFDRQRDPSHKHYSADFLYWAHSFGDITRVEAAGPLQVRITLGRPYAPFLATMAMFPVSIVSPTAVRKYGSDFDRHPVGTGPFRFESWSPGERIVLTRAANYWGPKPRVERLIFRALRDERQRLVALQSGSIDIAYGISPEDVSFVRLHPELVLHRVAAHNVVYLAMNNLRPPFTDVRVRQAVNHAVNKIPLVKLVYQGLGIAARGPLPPTMWGYRADLPSFAYDPALARRMLAEAGVKPGTVVRFYVPSGARPYLADPEKLGRVLARNLAEVGLVAHLIVQDFPKHLEDVRAGEHDLCLLGWSGDSGDPDNFLYVLFDLENSVPGAARNVAFYRNQEVHELLLGAQVSMDRAERERLYDTAQRIIAVDAPWVPLAHAEFVIATHEQVQGLLLHPAGLIYYRDVSLVP